MTLLEIRSKVEEISREVGTFIRKQRVSEGEIELKALNNLVSFVDKQAEQMFVEQLSALLPNAGFIAEEGTASHDDEEYLWVVDPLDGTTNFLHDIPAYCTSVALLQNKKPVVGVIYDPVREEMFSASKDGGATLNNVAINVSQRDQLGMCVLATGFPYDDFDRQEQYMEMFKELCRTSRGIRRWGSAAIDLAWVGCGRFDGFYEYGLNPWDVAAGILITEEAGGKVTSFIEGRNPIFDDEIIATNGCFHEELRQVAKRYFS